MLLMQQTLLPKHTSWVPINYNTLQGNHQVLRAQQSKGLKLWGLHTPEVKWFGTKDSVPAHKEEHN